MEEGTQHNLQEGRMKWFLQEVMYELGRDGNDVHSDIILLCVCVSQHRGLGGEQKLGSCPPPSGAPPTELICCWQRHLDVEGRWFL